MTEARQRESWARTSSVMALIANTQRDPKKTRAFKPRDFDPFQHQATATPKVGVDALKAVFIEKRTPSIPSPGKKVKP